MALTGPRLFSKWMRSKRSLIFHDFKHYFMFDFSALKILLQTEEDKLTVVLNNGLMSLADVSFCVY